jgi:hypothetical protein
MVKELVEWMIYAAAWELMFKGHLWAKPDTRNAAIDIIQEYAEV